MFVGHRGGLVDLTEVEYKAGEQDRCDTVVAAVA